ncbi:MAG TPA: phosphoribosylanthranilate isomerase, partial [Actinobacteria bacterium]|nr:phosphoribosylanthranilate isomerase [Actinomycetota bacterium]
MVRVKICGITNIEDALLAVRLGADALGFVLADSPRKADPEMVREVSLLLPPFISRVGVFVDEDEAEVRKLASFCALDTLQFHGVESPSYCKEFERKVIKALRVGVSSDLRALSEYPAYGGVAAFLLDTFVEGKPGGTGETFDWAIAREAKKFGKPIILSGGLDPDNVAQAIREVNPYAVDVSSGVESEPGKKDPEKMREFIRRAKS